MTAGSVCRTEFDSRPAVASEGTLRVATPRKINWPEIWCHSGGARGSLDGTVWWDRTARAKDQRQPRPNATSGARARDYATLQDRR